MQSLIQLFITLAIASSCKLNGIYIDSNKLQYQIFQDDLSTFSIISLNATAWSKASGTILGNTWCPGNIDGGSAATSCHNMQIIFDSGETLTSILEDDCNSIVNWSNEAPSWILPDYSLEIIDLVYMTHLDVGFTAPARNVCDIYFDKYFPLALNVSAELERRGGEERYSWTEFPWLIQEYLDNTVNCAHRRRTPDEISKMEEAISKGWMTWHANALNNFMELEDDVLLDFSFKMRDVLNTKFNKTNGALVGKHTDIPGMSISAVPILVKNNVKGFHIGYNGACKKPEVLDNVFIWRHNETQNEVLMMVEDNYGKRIRIPGHNRALHFMYQSDNTGPPTVDSVVSFWSKLRAQFPNAKITVSSMDDYVQSILNEKSLYNSLTVVTEEIGDSWLYGSPSDPLKLSTFREARRTMNEAIQDGSLSDSSPFYSAYMRRLLKGPAEHNWGLSIGDYIHDARAVGYWDNVSFHKVRKDKSRLDIAAVELEWQEQRKFCFPLEIDHDFQDNTKDYVQWLAFQDKLSSRLAALKEFDHYSNYVKDGSLVVDELPSTPVTCGLFNIGFDSKLGAINYLSSNGRIWSNKDNLLGLFSYLTYTEEEFSNFNIQYNPGCGPPCDDFSKRGMNSASPQYKTWLPKFLSSTFVSNTKDNGCFFSIQLALDPEANVKYGAARNISITINIKEYNESIDFTLHWANKTASRLAEASFLSFVPTIYEKDKSFWVMDILGHDVNPQNVIVNGTRHVHSIQSGCSFMDGNDQFTINSLDASLVSPGDVYHLLNYDGNNLPNSLGGMHFNVHNNLWGTSFSQWYEDDAKFRFTLDFKSPRDQFLAES